MGLFLRANLESIWWESAISCLMWSVELVSTQKTSSLPPLILIYKETNQEFASKFKDYDFPINSEFVITETGYKFQEKDKPMIEFDLLNNSLLVGKDSDPKKTAALIVPNIAFDYHMGTVSRKQFHITARWVLYHRSQSHQSHFL